MSHRHKLHGKRPRDFLGYRWIEANRLDVTGPQELGAVRIDGVRHNRYALSHGRGAKRTEVWSGYHQGDELVSERGELPPKRTRIGEKLKVVLALTADELDQLGPEVARIRGRISQIHHRVYEPAPDIEIIQSCGECHSCFVRTEQQPQSENRRAVTRCADNLDLELDTLSVMHPDCPRAGRRSEWKR